MRDAGVHRRRVRARQERVRARSRPEPTAGAGPAVEPIRHRAADGTQRTQALIGRWSRVRTRRSSVSARRIRGSGRPDRNGEPVGRLAGADRSVAVIPSGRIGSDGSRARTGGDRAVGKGGSCVSLGVGRGVVCAGCGVIPPFCCGSGRRSDVKDTQEPPFSAPPPPGRIRSEERAGASKRSVFVSTPELASPPRSAWEPHLASAGQHPSRSAIGRTISTVRCARTCWAVR